MTREVAEYRNEEAKYCSTLFWKKNQHWSNCLPVKYEGFVGLPNRDSALVVVVVIGMGYEIIENKNISTVGMDNEHDE